MRMGSRLAVAAMSAVLWVVPARALPLEPQAQEHVEPGADATTEASRTEIVQRELARIEVAFRVDGDAAAARDELTALVADAEQVRVMLADAELRATYERLKGDVEAGLIVSGESISEVVREAMGRFDMRTLQQLGQRAIDEVEAELVRASANDDLNASGSALQVLLDLAPARALELLQQPSVGGRLPNQTVLIALLYLMRSQNEWWTYVPGRTPQFTVPALFDQAVARLDVADRETITVLTDALCQALTQLTHRDVLPAPLCQAFARAAMSADRHVVTRLLQAIPDGVQAPSVQPFLEQLMSHPDDLVRAVVAQRLSRYRDSPALRAHANDPSADVRVWVSRLLQPKEVTTLKWPSRSDNSDKVSSPVRPDEDAEARGILTTLATDGDPLVREAAVDSIALLLEPLDQQVYLALAEDPDPGVRAALAVIEHRDEGFETELLTRLVRHGDATVVDSVLGRLHELSQDERNVDRVMQVLRAMPRVVHPGYEDPLEFIGEPLARFASGRNALTRWTLETGDPGPLGIVIRALGNNPNKGQLGDWLELQPGEVAQLFTLLAESEPMRFPAFAEVIATRESQDLARAMRPIFEDASQPVLVRLAAGASAVQAFDARLEELLVSLLSSEAIRVWQPRMTNNGPDERFLTYLIRAVPEADRNQVLLRLLTEPSVPVSLQQWLLEAYSPQAPDGTQLTELILRRSGVDPDGVDRCMQTAIWHAGSLRGQLDPQLLIAVTRRAWYAESAVKSMGRLREPVYLDTLRDCLRPDWLEYPWNGNVTAAAIDSLTAFMSDDAARILLQGAAEATSEKARDRCLEAVDTIRRYQDAVADWERRGSARETRDGAVSSLVAMADDPSPEVRAEALRALVTLRAVEYLPRIIQALKDDDAGVREAAREALARHHQLEAEADAASGASGDAVQPPDDVQPDEDEPEEGGG